VHVLRRGSGLFIAGGLVAVVVACSGTPKSGSDAVATSQEDLIGGDAGNPYNTGAIKIRYGCSATMIGANQILTAAHCVTKDGTGALPSNTVIDDPYAAGNSISFTNSPTADNNANWFSSTVMGVDLSPAYMKACSSGCVYAFETNPPYAPDVAIITIADTFPDSFGYTATVASASPGDAVTESGYGCTVNINDPTPNPRYFKDAPATILDPTNAASLTAPGFNVSNVAAFSANYFITAGQAGGGNASICPGDSGGSLFKGATLTQFYSEVVGVNAYYFFPTASGTISSYNVFTRLDTQDVADLLSTTAIEYPAPSGRGSPINNTVDPISVVFPVSTVALETPGTMGCTGVILTDNTILTAAHCNVGPTTIAHFYVSDAHGTSLPTPALDIPASSAPVATQGVTCKTSDLTFPQSCFVPNKSGTGSHNADLAVLTLSKSIPSTFSPVVLATEGYGAQGLSPATLPTWWEVTTGGPALINDQSREEWAPVTYDPSSDTDQPQGYFFIHSIYGLSGDSGGPVFQAPASLSSSSSSGGSSASSGGTGSSSGGAAGTGGFANLALLGLVSDISPCLSGDTCEHTNMVVSVAQPDNYEWLVGLGGSPVPAVATFGASK
jgi:V8-like Glu-specific endopeptidase